MEKLCGICLYGFISIIIFFPLFTSTGVYRCSYNDNVILRNTLENSDFILILTFRLQFLFFFIVFYSNLFSQQFNNSGPISNLNVLTSRSPSKGDIVSQTFRDKELRYKGKEKYTFLRFSVYFLLILNLKTKYTKTDDNNKSCIACHVHFNSNFSK